MEKNSVDKISDKKIIFLCNIGVSLFDHVNSAFLGWKYWKLKLIIVYDVLLWSSKCVTQLGKGLSYLMLSHLNDDSSVHFISAANDCVFVYDSSSEYGYGYKVKGKIVLVFFWCCCTWKDSVIIIH